MSSIEVGQNEMEIKRVQEMKAENLYRWNGGILMKPA
jgi:hypothetical protein